MPRFFCILTTLWIPIVCAASMAEPLLIIKGNISVFNNPKKNEYHLTENELKKYQTHAIRTKTTWTPEAVFTGPRLADILTRIGAKGTHIKTFSYDEFSSVISISELREHGSILARRMNNTLLTRRDFGPLWLIYSGEKYKEPQLLETDSKFVWLLETITVL